MAGAAQTSLAQTQTDEVMVLNFNLTAVSQGAVTTGRDGITSDVQVTKITSKEHHTGAGRGLGGQLLPKGKIAGACAHQLPG